MSKAHNYEILGADDLHTLECLVEEALIDGCELVGGVAVAAAVYTDYSGQDPEQAISYTYLQAVIKRDIQEAQNCE